MENDERKFDCIYKLTYEDCKECCFYHVSEDRCWFPRRYDESKFAPREIKAKKVRRS